MRNTDEQRYNLVFAGQLLPGTDRQRAQRTLAAFFGIEDPSAVASFFSGNAIPLRRNLRHEDAFRLYRQLRSDGLICEVPRSGSDPASVHGTRPDGRAAASNRTRASLTAAEPPAPARPVAQAKTTVSARRTASARPGPGEHGERLDDPPGREGRRRDTRPPRNPVARPPEPSPGVAPNPFALRPAVAPHRGQQQADQQRLQARVAAAFAGVLCLVVLAVSLRFPEAPPEREPIGPLAAVSREGGELILLLPQALLLHARSGLPDGRIDAADLGLEAFAPPLLAVAGPELIVAGNAPGENTRLMRCHLKQMLCDTILEAQARPWPPAVALSYLGDTLFLHFADGTMLRMGTDGNITNSATTPATRQQPALHYVDGLLLLPSDQGPMLGVFRPDPDGFGEQLDALLLAPVDQAADTIAAIRDIAVVGDDRWAILAGKSGDHHLYRFDRQWGSGVRVASDVHAGSYLVPWRDRLLVTDRMSAVAQRVAPDGRIEANFESPLLHEEHEAWRRVTQQRALLRRVGVVVPLLLACLAVATALVCAASASGLASLPPVLTARLDLMPAGIRWLPAIAERERRAAGIGIVLLLLALAPSALLLAAGAWLAAACFLPALLAGLYASSAMRRGLGGHLGLRAGQVIVIDHDGRYFLGDARALRSGAGVLFAPGVALPLGAAGITRVVARETILAAVTRLATHAALGLLWQYRHPWLTAAMTAAVGWLLTLAALLMTA